MQKLWIRSHTQTSTVHQPNVRNTKKHFLVITQQINEKVMNDPANEYIESAVIAFLAIVGVVLFFVGIAKIITYRKRD